MGAIRFVAGDTGARFDRPELDLLRLFAFFLVFFRHAPPFLSSTQPLLHVVNLITQGGGFGVDVFFVLSAYLITELLRREKLRSGTIDLKAFYMRRILRIWPLYYVFLFSVAFFTRHSSVRLPVAAVLALSLLVGNWYCTQGFLEGPAFPLWSVSIEEQFYLAWPLVVRSLRRGQVIALSCGLIAAAAGVKILLLAHSATYPAIWCNTFARMDTIAVGVLTAYLLQGRVPELSSPVRGGLFLLGILGLYSSVARFNVFSPTSVTGGMFGYACGLLAAIAFFFSIMGAWQNGLPSALKPLRFLGRISYGLYVFHVLGIELWAPPHFAALHTLPAILTTIVFASVSYHVLEKPFLLLKGRFTRVRSAAVAA